MIIEMIETNVVIQMIGASVALLAMFALVVVFVDTARSEAWRSIAAERRRNWESRQPGPYGGEPWTDTWQDD